MINKERAMNSIEFAEQVLGIELSYSQKTLLTILEEHKDKNLRIFIGTRRRDYIPGIWRGYMDFLLDRESMDKLV